MAAHSLFNELGCRDGRIIRAFYKLVTGSTGAVAATSAGKGVRSITRIGTGRYTIVFDDSYFAGLKSLHATIIGTAANTPNGKADGYKLLSLTMTGSAPQVDVQFTFSNGTAAVAAELEDTATVLFAFTFGDSTV